ncbi:amidohydrolase family protein [Desertibaculum subflavum]|uniref:amidohydrolase family protein n=1 Tax=Desertibaculum subflavum TaxID=2268458 RepID=UPI000E674683
MRGAIAGLLLLLAGGPVATGAERIPFIDAHVHLNNPEQQRALMAEYGIKRAVVFWGRSSSNDSILAAAAAHPDLFIPFVSISPERQAYRALWTRDTADTAPPRLDELEAQLATGKFRGIGEISVVHFPGAGFPEADFDPLSPVMQRIMVLAKQYDLPVLIHCEITRLREFSELLEHHPEVQVIWAHGGYSPLFLAERMLRRHPNLHYELSARTWPQHPRSPDYTILRNGAEVWPEWLKLIEAMPTRFLVGTDATQRNQALDRGKIESVQNFLAQLSPAARKAVAEDNLLRLLKL